MTKLAGVVEATAVRPFQVNIPETELTELRRRITATRLPEKETVNDFSQGVPLATVEMSIPVPVTFTRKKPPMILKRRSLPA